jgi:predicted transcriptional regulator
VFKQCPCQLALLRAFSHIGAMTQKQLVLEAIKELPEETSLREIVERIEFLAAIQKGIDQLDHGESIPHDEVKRQLATWLAK